MVIIRDPQIKHFLLLMFLVIIGWGIVFYPGISSAVKVWSVSEIFTHSFFVIPVSLYLIYQKRFELIQTSFVSNFWLIPILVGCLFVQLFGYLGDIKLLMHLATFSALPLIIWMMIGNQGAQVILFPLFFMLFSIPVGEQLIPYLQELTTDLAVPMLEMTGVPIYRNGLYLDIPEGRFLVAEACSGISFLITAVVFGFLYAYISFSTLRKQILFVGTSIIVPIAANAIRVYGIILTGHLSNMEYAVGADHLIYGGVFYAIILLLLISIGEKFRDKEITIVTAEQVSAGLSIDHTKFLKMVLVILVLFISQIVWTYSIDDIDGPGQETLNKIQLDKLNVPVLEKDLVNWKPTYHQATEVRQGIIQIDKDNQVEFFIADYRSLGKNSGELISSLNRLYSDDRWTLLSEYSASLYSLGGSLMITEVTSATGQVKLIAHWYELKDKRFTSKVKAKLYRTGMKMLKLDGSGAVIAFSKNVKTDKNSTKQSLLNFIDFIAPNIKLMMEG